MTPRRVLYDVFSKREPSTACKGYSLYPNLKARVISTDMRYHVRLKHLVTCLLMTARAYIVRRIALLFLSRCS